MHSKLLRLQLQISLGLNALKSSCGFIFIHFKSLLKTRSPFRETLIFNGVQCTITTSKQNSQLKQTQEDTQCGEADEKAQCKYKVP